MKVGFKFKTISEFTKIKHKRKCWQSCKLCDCNWSELNTDFVHLLSTEKGIFYICDECEKQLKNE